MPVVSEVASVVAQLAFRDKCQARFSLACFSKYATDATRMAFETRMRHAGKDMGDFATAHREADQMSLVDLDTAEQRGEIVGEDI